MQHCWLPSSGLADGIVVTPSHNPPEDGGFKYNPPHSGPADTGITHWIEAAANELLKGRLEGVKRMPAERALGAARPSGTEEIYKIYAESLRGEDHLRRIVEEAQAIVDDALTSHG